jgi:hypothetical protein
MGEDGTGTLGAEGVGDGGEGRKPGVGCVETSPLWPHAAKRKQVASGTKRVRMSVLVERDLMTP